MEFDHNFVGKFPHFSEKYPENPCVMIEIPTMVPVQPISTISPHPSHTTILPYQNDLHHFQQYHLNGDINHSSVIMESTSSIGPINMIPTPFSNACISMTFPPNHNKIEAMHGYLNNGENMWDFSQNLSPQHCSNFESQMGHSLSPSLVSDAHASIPMKLSLQDELSDIVGTNKNLGDTDQRLMVGENKLVMENKYEIHDGDTNIIKGQWTAEEDRALVKLVKKFGLKRWSQIARLLNCRIGKQCRERWHNHLRPNIKKDSWTGEEEKILIESHQIVGNQWAKIAKRLPWRTENGIKNHWNATRRKLNVKKKQNMLKGGPKGTLLLDYIRKVIVVEGSKKEVKQSMSLMNIRSEKDNNNNNEFGLINVHYESSKSDFSSEGWATQEDKVGGYVPSVSKAEEMTYWSDTMNYEIAMKMVLEDPMKSEMDLLEMIHLKP